MRYIWLLFFFGILMGCENSGVNGCRDYNLYIKMKQADGVSTGTPLFLNNEAKIGKVISIEQLASGDLLFKTVIDCNVRLPVTMSVSLDWSSPVQMERIFDFEVKQHNQPYFVADDTITVTNITR